MKIQSGVIGLLLLAILLGASLLGCTGTLHMRIGKQTFGEIDGKTVDLYTLTNSSGATARITNYGCIVTELHVPDRDGNLADVVLGFDRLDGYLGKHPYFGAIVGRVANRIAKGRFSLDDKNYTLAVNNGPNHLHGGLRGFDKVLWDAEAHDTADGPALTLTYLSADGEEGYPGNLKTTVVSTLTHANQLKIEMTAETDAPTPVNMANHSYWNLSGHDSGDILGHQLCLNADSYTPTDEWLIPTGAFAPVEGTPFDFRKPKTIGADIARIPGNPEMNNPGGFDTNFVLNGENGGLKLAARVVEPGSGRVMEVFTTEPGVQFYSGNFLDGSVTGKGGAVYEQRNGFCLETQHFPDSINKPGWPTVVLRPGKTYRHVVVYAFS